MAWLDDRRLAFKLRDSHDWSQGTDGAPETVLNFKFCRQATNKVAGISGDVAAFLDDLF